MFTSRMPLVAALLLPGALQAVELETIDQRYSYVRGFVIAQSLKNDGAEVDLPAFTQAIQDVLSGAEPALSRDEMMQAQQDWKAEMTRQRVEASARNKQQEQEFLEANRAKEGVSVLKNGIQYTVLKQGDGPKPAPGSRVTVHYRGTLLDGTEFDSSYARGEPATFNLNQVIKGWQEVLPEMPQGSKWQVVIPSALAYGPRGWGGRIGPDATLIFEIELLNSGG